MVEQHRDPIHRFVTIDEPACLAALEALEADWERLKHIAALGVIAQVVGPATHSKREHHIGMYYLSTQIPNIKAEERKRLGLVCLLRGIGHLPFTYSVEEGVILAARLSGEFRKTLEALLVPVEEACRRQKAWAGEGSHIDRMVERHAYKELYKWFSALKILNARLGDRVGESVDSLVTDIACPDRLIYRMAEELSVVDYVQRDIYYSGLAELRLEPREVLDEFAAGFADVADSVRGPELGLVHQARAYLYDRLYGTKEILGIDGRLKKQVALMLLGQLIDVPALMEMTDYELSVRIDELAKEYEYISNLVSLRRVSWATVLRSDLRTQLPPPELETRIVGCDETTLLLYPQMLDSLVSVLLKPSGQTAVALLAKQDAQRLAPLALVAANLELLFSQESVAELLEIPFRSYGADLLAFVFGSRVEMNANTAVSAVQAWMRRPGTKTVRRLLKETTKPTELDEWPLVFRALTMLGPESFGEFAGSEFARAVLFGRSFKVFGRRVAGAMLEDASKPQAGEWLPDADKAEELMAFLKLLATTSSDYESWVLPNVTIAANGKAQSEVDVITIELLDQQVRVMLYECSTQTSTQKALDDLQKILRLAAQPLKRFTDLAVDGQVVTSANIVSKFIGRDEFLRR